MVPMPEVLLPPGFTPEPPVPAPVLVVLGSVRIMLGWPPAP